MEEIIAYIGLGTNLGDRQAHVSRALELLGAVPQISIEQVSERIETDPIGVTDQPKFINCAVKIKTTLDPFHLRDVCLDIEKKMGRVRRERWGPRLIDLDILLYGSKKIEDRGLKIPHPEIGNRPFVQAGLKELGAHV